MLRAKDVMQTRLIRVGAEASLLSIHRLFCDEEINGAPVVAETGEVLGVVTIRDLLTQHREAADFSERHLKYFRDSLIVDSVEARAGDRADFEGLARYTVSDVMSHEVISVEPDSPIKDTIDKVLEFQVQRVLVLDPAERGGSLVGIVSVFDLVQLLV